MTEIAAPSVYVPTRRRWSMPSLSTAALYAFLTVYCLINLFPLIWLVLSTFKTNDQIYDQILALPTNWRLDNYFKAWADGNMSHYMLNSVLVTVPTLAIVLLLGSMAAYILARVMPNNLIYSYFTLGIVIPVHVILIPSFILIRGLGLINSPIALILLYSATNLPIAIFILVGFMRTIPKELEEAATVDGASRASIFFRIILPISRAGLAVVGTLTFLYCWNEYLLAVVMISTHESKTLPQGIYALRGQYTTDYGLLTAGLTLSIIPVIIIYILFQEQFIKGATAGSTVG